MGRRMSENSTTPSVAEALAADGFASLRSDADAGRQAYAWRVLDERGAAEEMVRDQYTGRYPLELVQNANDAAASPGATGRRVRFVVTPWALLVADEGAGFGDDQVRAICGLARSSKDARKSIGHKGLGFKAVREITDRPQIVAAQSSFGFDAERLRHDVTSVLGPSPLPGQRLPDYAFPYRVTEEDLGPDAATVTALRADGFGTILRLPFRAGISPEAVSDHLCQSLDPRVLLFLDGLERIEVVGTKQDFVAEVARTSNDRVELRTSAGIRRFLLYTETIPVPEKSLVECLGRGWSDVEAVRVAAAVPLDSGGRPERSESERLRVYFPTEEAAGLPLILNADFQTELDRRRISSTGDHEPYNAWLADELARFVTGPVAGALLEAFPGDPAVSACLVPGPASPGAPRFASDSSRDCGGPPSSSVATASAAPRTSYDSCRRDYRAMSSCMICCPGRDRWSTTSSTRALGSVGSFAGSS